MTIFGGIRKSRIKYDYYRIVAITFANKILFT